MTLYTREVTVLIRGGEEGADGRQPNTHGGLLSPPLMSHQTTAKSKELRKGNTEIKTAANVFSDILIPNHFLILFDERHDMIILIIL